VFLRRDLINGLWRRHHGPDPVQSLVQELCELAAWRRQECAARELPMPVQQRRLATARRLIAREVSLGQILCEPTAKRVQDYATRRPQTPMQESPLAITRRLIVQETP